MYQSVTYGLDSAQFICLRVILAQYSLSPMNSGRRTQKNLCCDQFHPLQHHVADIVQLSSSPTSVSSYVLRYLPNPRGTVECHSPTLLACSYRMFLPWLDRERVNFEGRNSYPLIILERDPMSILKGRCIKLCPEIRTT